MDARDNSLHDILFRGLSRPRRVGGGVLRLPALRGAGRLRRRRRRARPGRPVRRRGARRARLIGSEISLGPHLNQYGGDQAPYDYGDIRSLGDKPGDGRSPRSSTTSTPRAGSPRSTTPAPGHHAARAAAPAADMIEVGFGKGGPGSLRAARGLGHAQPQRPVPDRQRRLRRPLRPGLGHQDNRYYTAAWAHAIAQPALLDALGRGPGVRRLPGLLRRHDRHGAGRQVPMGSVVSARRRADAADRRDRPARRRRGRGRARSRRPRRPRLDPTPGTTVVQPSARATLARAARSRSTSRRLLPPPPGGRRGRRDRRLRPADLGCSAESRRGGIPERRRAGLRPGHSSRVPLAPTTRRRARLLARRPQPRRRITGDRGGPPCATARARPSTRDLPPGAPGGRCCRGWSRSRRSPVSAVARGAPPRPLRPRAQNQAGLNAYALAMHLHASSSEGAGSVRSQLAPGRAQRLRRRLVQRPRLASPPPAVPADLLVHRQRDSSSAAPGTSRRSRAPVRWPPSAAGPRVDADEPERPRDPEGLAAACARPAPGRRGHGAQPDQGGGHRRAPTSAAGSPDGPSSLDVLPSKTASTPGARCCSGSPTTPRRHPALRRLTPAVPPAPDITAPARSSSGLAGFVDVPVTAGGWQTVTLDPVADAAAIWPDADA